MSTTPTHDAREVPARSIPVPDTVSPQLQAIIARPHDPNFNIAPETTAEWKARVAEDARNIEDELRALLALADPDHPILRQLDSTGDVALREPSK